jgi:hypothetical protein
MMRETRTPLQEVIENLAASRDYSGLEELAEAVNEETGEDYMTAELEDWPRPGFGNHLSSVLHPTSEEKCQIVWAWVETVKLAKK